MTISFECVPFVELTPQRLYDILQLRSEVFVVEQECAYLDLDGLDQEALHILGVRDGVIVATARILAPGGRHAHVSIGRVVTAPSARGEGLGRALMEAALQETMKHFGAGTSVALSAQSYLLPFYESLGFVVTSEEYLEDDIPHTDMLRR